MALCQLDCICCSISDLADSLPPVPSPPQHKHSMYLDRLLLVQQRLRRNPLFQSANLILPGSGGAHTAHVRSSLVITQMFLILKVLNCSVCSLSSFKVLNYKQCGEAHGPAIVYSRFLSSSQNLLAFVSLHETRLARQSGDDHHLCYVALELIFPHWSRGFFRTSSISGAYTYVCQVIIHPSRV